MKIDGREFKLRYIKGPSGAERMVHFHPVKGFVPQGYYDIKKVEDGTVFGG